MKYKIKPYKHQLQAIKLAETQRDLALFWDMGTGKTAAIVNILRQHYNREKSVSPTLIIAPIVTLTNWVNEFRIHSSIPDAKIRVLTGSGKTRLKRFHAALEESVSIIVVNYEAVLNRDLFNAIMEWGPHYLICDEAHYLKAHNSKRTKNIIKLAKPCKNRYILTGTPILNSPTDVFSQYQVLDAGETFGNNYWHFRNTFFAPSKMIKNARGNLIGTDFELQKSMKERFLELIHRKALRVKKADCLDLPPLVRKNFYIPLSKEQARMYRDMEKNCIAFMKEQNGLLDATVAQLAVTKALRLQQILCGFIKNESGEEKEIEGTNPRLDALKEHLTEITPRHKVIVWCNFRRNYDQVSKVCDLMHLEYRMIQGLQNQAQKDEAIESFRNNPDVRVLIANARSGGVGINLVEASYSIVFSRNFNLGEQLQAEARNYRGGSQMHESITQINFIAPETIDERIVRVLDKKRAASDDIVDNTDHVRDIFRHWL